MEEVIGEAHLNFAYDLKHLNKYLTMEYFKRMVVVDKMTRSNYS